MQNSTVLEIVLANAAAADVRDAYLAGAVDETVVAVVFERVCDAADQYIIEDNADHEPWLWLY